MCEKMRNSSGRTSLKPAISHFYSFVLSLLFQLVNNILFATKQRKQLAAVKLAKLKNITRVINDFDCQRYLLICFQFALVFIESI